MGLSKIKRKEVWSLAKSKERIDKMAGARVAKRVWTEHGVVGLWRWQVWGYGFVEDG